MERAEAFRQIEIERESQDLHWSDRTQYKRSAPHILVLEGQMKKLVDDWYNGKRDALTERFVKIAAIAVRALEEVDPQS